MTNNECNCEKGTGMYKDIISTANCKLHNTVPVQQMTNNNWEEDISKEIQAIIKAPLRSQFSTSDIVIGYFWSSTTLSEKTHDLTELFRQELTKKDQEHKAELEMIKGEIKELGFSICSAHQKYDEDCFICKSSSIRTEDALSILDKHINK